MMRPVMTKDELAKHWTGRRSRNYKKSDDGYDDMALAEQAAWSAIANWGRDGWDLGEWPYVAIYKRGLEVMQIVEGDHDLYRFETIQDRDAAIDYLFLWYAAGKSWAPLTYEDRERLDAGELEVEERFRGAYVIP